MQSTLKAITTDTDKALSGGKVKAAILVPKILDDLTGLLAAIINALPEDPHGK